MGLLLPADSMLAVAKALAGNGSGLEAANDSGLPMMDSVAFLPKLSMLLALAAAAVTTGDPESGDNIALSAGCELAGLGTGAVRSSCARNGEDLSNAVVVLVPNCGVLILKELSISAAAGVASFCFLVAEAT